MRLRCFRQRKFFADHWTHRSVYQTGHECGGEGYTSADDADNSKPAPDIFAASLKKLGGISPADAVTVGDIRFDIEAARKAGLKTIAFLCGGTSESVLREAGAVAIYRDPADFLAHYDDLSTQT